MNTAPQQQLGAGTWYNNLAAGINAGASAGNFLTDLIYGNRNYKAARRDAEWNKTMSERAYYHGVTDRMEDMIRAGLHPTLAAGNSATAPLTHPTGDVGRGRRDPNLMAMAQLDLLEAQKTEMLARADEHRANADRTRQTEWRDLVNHTWMYTDSNGRISSDHGYDIKTTPMHISTVIAHNANINQAEAIAWLNKVRAKYAETYGMEMGHRDSGTQEIENILKALAPDAAKGSHLAKSTIDVISRIITRGKSRGITIYK